MKILVLLLLVLTGMFTTSTAIAAKETSLKIVYLDVANVFDNSKQGEKAKTRIKEYVDSRQRIINIEEEELKTMESELIRQTAVLSRELMREKEKNFQMKLKRYQDKVQELGKEIQEKKLEILADFNRALGDIVKELSEKNGYDLVLDKNPETGFVLYGSSELNITDQIVKKMNESK